MLTSFAAYDPTFDTYGTLTLTAGQTAPTEPLTVAEAKQFLRVDHDEDDALIAAFISSARSQAELMQQRVLVRKQYDLTFDYWPSYRIELASPTVSVDLVTYTNSDGVVHTLTSGTDYIADLHKQPAVIASPVYSSWPSFTPQPSSSILIRFTAGYAHTDPFWMNSGSRLKTGMLLLISDWYNNRLPFAAGASAIAKYPDAVQFCFGQGALRRAR